ncbi:MAG: hypothetical protein HQ541_07765, partial [Mariniphaga sp.]|nr:hypothetical protein [Mariniphaga sp.]
LIENNAANYQDQKVKLGLDKKRKRKNLFISIIFIVVFAAILFIVFNITSVKQNNFGNSIALLPLKNFSQEKNNEYIINRLENQIIAKLYRIEGLKVVPHSAVGFYKDSKKRNREIAGELLVNYILQGNVTIIGSKMSVNLELIEAASENLLGTYSDIMTIDDPENIFDIQEKIALKIAEELDIPLTPEEEEQITKPPSKNPAALYKFNQAQAYIDVGEPLEAKKLLKEAIMLDSTFADAFAGMGFIYIDKLSYTGDRYLADLYLDSGMVMVEKALFLEKKHQWANNLKYSYFLRKGLSEEAKEMETIFDRMIKNYQYYQTRFGHYCLIEDFYHAIDAFYKYLELKPNDQLTPLYMLFDVRECFDYTGFSELAKIYSKEQFEQTNDSIGYFKEMAWIEHKLKNFKEAINLCYKGCQLDSSRFLYQIMVYHIYLNDYVKAFEYLKKEEKSFGNQEPDMIFGLVFLKNGYREEAEYHLRGVLKHFLEVVEMNTALSRKTFDFFYLSGIYSALGDKKNALKYLKKLKEMEVIRSEYVLDLKIWPGFDNIRDEPEFREILNDAETKYQNEHEKVEQLLIRKGIIES